MKVKTNMGCVHLPFQKAIYKAHNKAFLVMKLLFGKAVSKLKCEMSIIKQMELDISLKDI